jgi:hypothetical protein
MMGPADDHLKLVGTPHPVDPESGAEPELVPDDEPDPELELPPDDEPDAELELAPMALDPEDPDELDPPLELPPEVLTEPELDPPLELPPDVLPDPEVDPPPELALDPKLEPPSCLASGLLHALAAVSRPRMASLPVRRIDRRILVHFAVLVESATEVPPCTRSTDFEGSGRLSMDRASIMDPRARQLSSATARAGIFLGARSGWLAPSPQRVKLSRACCHCSARRLHARSRRRPYR